MSEMCCSTTKKHLLSHLCNYTCCDAHSHTETGREDLQQQTVTMQLTRHHKVSGGKQLREWAIIAVHLSHLHMIRLPRPCVNVQLHEPGSSCRLQHQTDATSQSERVRFMQRGTAARPQAESPLPHRKLEDLEGITADRLPVKPTSYCEWTSGICQWSICAGCAFTYCSRSVWTCRLHGCSPCPPSMQATWMIFTDVGMNELTTDAQHPMSKTHTKNAACRPFPLDPSGAAVHVTPDKLVWLSDAAMHARR